MKTAVHWQIQASVFGGGGQIGQLLANDSQSATEGGTL